MPWRGAKLPIISAAVAICVNGGESGDDVQRLMNVPGQTFDPGDIVGLHIVRCAAGKPARWILAGVSAFGTLAGWFGASRGPPLPDVRGSDPDAAVERTDPGIARCPTGTASLHGPAGGGG